MRKAPAWRVHVKGGYRLLLSSLADRVLPRGISRFSALWRAFRHPIAPDTRQALARAWRRLPAKYLTLRQFLGRQYAGCGATIGAMPRCDFACRGCYLGGDANRTPELPSAELESQLRQIRDWLGEHIWSTGSTISSQQIMHNATGEGTNAEHFLTYIEARYLEERF